MKAITLTQPYATLVAIGAKRVETRSWQPPAGLIYERVAIHAGKGLGPVGGEAGLRHLLDGHYFNDTLGRHFYPDHFARAPVAPRADVEQLAGLLPRGAIVATAVLWQPFHTAHMNLDYLPAQENAFGDYSVGRYAWPLRDVVVLPEPVEVTGRQRFFNVPESAWMEALA